MLISVVIPCYNCENYIKDTIFSVLNQTHQQIQVICVDNNSTDNTVNVIKSLLASNLSIEFYSEKRVGANYARNLGLSKAKGDYIQFLDSDDIITPNKFKEQLESIMKKDSDLVVSDRIVFDATLEKEITRYEFSSIIKNPLQIAISEIIITGNPIYKTSFVRKIGGYKDNLQSSQDWEFHIRCFLNNPKLTYLKGTFLHSRTLVDSLSNKDYVSVSNTACLVINEYKKQLIKHKVYLDFAAYKKILFSYFISYIHTKELHFKEEFLFWYSINNGIKVFSGINKLMIKSIGIKYFLQFKKIKN